jgi:DNA-binding transcriptional ArsR family regulator
MHHTMTPELFRLLSARFKALAEPARLQLLHVLHGRELSVNELVEETGLGQANVSKHLQVLHSTGFVKRRKEGLFVHYAHADRNVMKVCDLMCGRLESQLETQKRLLVG